MKNQTVVMKAMIMMMTTCRMAVNADHDDEDYMAHDSDGSEDGDNDNEIGPPHDNVDIPGE